MLRLNVDLFEAHQKSSDIIWKSEHLEPKVKEFIYIAIDVTVTHLYEPGLRLHIKNALARGATVQEIAEVISFVSTAGLATLSMGLPLIVEEAQAVGMPVEQCDSGLQRKLATNFRERLGYIPEGLEILAALDSTYFRALTDVSAAASWCKELSPKIRAFVRLAAQITATSLNREAARIHIREALAHGATIGELVEVLELVSVVGLHSCTFGGAILYENGG
jgi:alkylhydroperoxidase/carboxymuconolactone decarboxylase family protein YurZ